MPAALNNLQFTSRRRGELRARFNRITETLGHVPPYATAAQGGPVDVTPKEGGRRKSISAPPGQEVSASEFQEMVRELDVETTKPEPQPAATGASNRPAGGRRARARANGAAEPPPAAPSAGTGESDPPAKDRKPRNKRHWRPR